MILVGCNAAVTTMPDVVASGGSIPPLALPYCSHTHPGLNVSFFADCRHRFVPIIVPIGNSDFWFRERPISAVSWFVLLPN